MSTLQIVGAVLALAIGLWAGAGAPGWPWRPPTARRHTELRDVNPISWGRRTSRRRLEPRTPEERRRRLRGE